MVYILELWSCVSYKTKAIDSLRPTRNSAVLVEATTCEWNNTKDSHLEQVRCSLPLAVRTDLTPANSDATTCTHSELLRIGRTYEDCSASPRLLVFIFQHRLTRLGIDTDYQQRHVWTHGVADGPVHHRATSADEDAKQRSWRVAASHGRCFPR